MNRSLATLLGLALALAPLGATDPPHNFSTVTNPNNPCASCHQTHNAPGGNLTTAAGNANLCISCHKAGGSAATLPFATADQALPPAGLPTGTTATGTSHRWDANASGRLVKGTPNTSTGTITLSGTYALAYPTTIQIKISTAGASGTAKFDWQMVGSGTTAYGAWTTAVTTSATPVALGTTGLSLAFPAGGTFVLNDIWLVYTRGDLRNPTTYASTLRLENGTLMCSTCHDQHLQALKPFAGTGTYTPGVTNNWHFQRVLNDTDQMCVDCHAPRNVIAKGGTSHPVGSLAITASSGDWKVPTSAVRDSNNFTRCQSCHKVHHTTTNDGNLLRITNSANALCDDCHTYRSAGAAVTGNHFHSTTGVIWPGGESHTIGGVTIPASTYPAQAAGSRGYCANCHVPHGWPDAADNTKHYARMLVQQPSTLCLTCHDATPQVGATNVEAEISKAIRHPIERTTGRTVTCGDCHNPHKAAATPSASADSKSHKYSTTATSTRNQILTTFTGPLVGADGVRATTYPAWATPAGGVYAAAVPATYEYEICFKCHSSYSFGVTPPNGITTGGTSPLTLVSGSLQPWVTGTGTAKFTNASATVTGTGTSWTSAMVGKYIRPTGSTSTNYRISAVASATSLTISTNFTQTTTASVAYETRVSATFAASTTVTGFGTAWTSAMIGQFIAPSASGPTGTSYRITAVGSATSLTIANNATATTYQDFYIHPGASFTNGSAAVVGYGTTWDSSLVGQTIQASGQAGTNVVASVTDATHLTLTANYTGTTGIYRYLLAGPILLALTDTALEFSLANGSFHPVVGGLNSGTGNGSTNKALVANQLVAPWTTNIGTQTMLCSDCHSTDAATTAAQGPHGSAVQFMLRGPNGANWPNVVLSSGFATSWCANCHQNNAGEPHSRSDHSARRCYECHIIVPHGGKLHRLIGDGTAGGGMPARYAWNNTKSNTIITGFTKTATASYQKSNCGTSACTGDHPATNGTHW
ncbi:MAG: hypothetical protein HY823_02210 [Acidobacteria bacterium]|nr:hypothetical protein [Acidobacteriota bacterium]